MRDEEDAAEAVHKWDVLFFVHGIPKEAVLSADNLRTATITEKTWPLIEKLIELVPQAKPFFDTRLTNKSICAFKTEAKTSHNALKQAHEKLGYYLDALGASGFPVPVLSDVAQLRRDDDKDADIYLFYRDRWLQMNSEKKDGLDKWRTRSGAILDHLLPLLSQLIEGDWDQRDELVKRALYSTRLFRKGIESKAFGMEFLCKFAALENLVVGGERSRKGEKLVRRLEELVGIAMVDAGTVIKKMWDLRHAIVHEARIEFMGGDLDAYPVHIHMEELNWLFQVASVFHADHFGVVTSMKDLWDRAKAYPIPAHIAEMRPSEIGLFPASSWAENRHVVWHGAGLLIDLLWRQTLPSGTPAVSNDQPSPC